MSRARAATLALIPAIGLIVASAGCSGSAGPASRAAGVLADRLAWRPCPGAADGAPTAARLRCASLRVPLNYADPGGRTITLALSEVPATAPPAQRQGVLLVNPGGPGASGLWLAADTAARLAPSVAADYDIVGFDPRGVGSSVPALSCDPAFFSRPRPGYVPAGPGAEQVLENRARQYAADCEKRFGWLLPYMTSEDMARDMDSIRAALGQRQISYYGISYGTYLGQVYATLFPHRVRRMVLDSVVDPAGAWYADNLDQDYPFQVRMNAFFGWIAGNDAAYHLGATRAAVAASYAAAEQRLATQPISGSSGPLIGPDELSDTLLLGGYYEDWWPPLAAAFSDYLHGSSSQLISVYQEVGQQDENEFAVYNAVQCSDVAWPRDWGKWDADTSRLAASAPYETWANVWFNASCAFWPVRGPAAPLRVTGAGLAPILMLQGTLDAATPYQGALVARRLLPSARMVAVVGSGTHGQSLTSPPNNCVDGYLDNYLATGALPEHPGLINATCAALPAPAA